MSQTGFVCYICCVVDVAISQNKTSENMGPEALSCTMFLLLNLLHLSLAGCCYSTTLQKRHPCIEKSMHHNCSVCFEYLFDSMKDITVMPCGHTMHLECLREMHRHAQYFCPICSKSVCDMTSIWRHIDEEIAATPMPEAYQNKLVIIPHPLPCGKPHLSLYLC
jgi:hypothetical protein